jgi:hypothetical protein
MVLTFKSSSPHQMVVVDQAPDGRRRVGRAIQLPHNSRHWDLRVEHPSGQVFTGTYTGGGELESIVALADLMGRRKNEYIADKARGDKRHEGVADRSVSVSEQGDGGVVLKNYLTR